MFAEVGNRDGMHAPLCNITAFTIKTVGCFADSCLLRVNSLNKVHILRKLISRNHCKLCVYFFNF